MAAAAAWLQAGAPQDLAIREGGAIDLTAEGSPEKDLLVLPFAWEDAAHWQLTVNGRSGCARTGVRRVDGRAPAARRADRAAALPPTPGAALGPGGVRRGRAGGPWLARGRKNAAHRPPQTANRRKGKRHEGPRPWSWW